jgi:hypothetical protein
MSISLTYAWFLYAAQWLQLYIWTCFLVHAIHQLYVGLADRPTYLHLT